MSLTLHNLKASKKATKRRKRVGRGNASGKGTYSGRGLKGQRSRSGGKSGLKMMGIKAYIFRIPKNKGFKSLADAPATINLQVLDKIFADGEIVTPKKLLNKGLIRKSTKKYKILSKGKINKKLIVKAHAFSVSARQAIIKAGGQIEEILIKSDKPKKK